MRKTTYVCDRCRVEGDTSGMTSVIVSPYDRIKEIPPTDLCSRCSHLLRKFLKGE